MFRKSENLYWLWLSTRIGNANPYFQTLLDTFSSILGVYRADRDALAPLGLPASVREAVLQKDLGAARGIDDFCRSHGADILSYADPRYPEALRSLQSPPMVLYVTGRFPDVNRNLCISMVGTRGMTEYGMHAAYKIAYELASAGVIVVSGMALGIDAVSACAALAAGGKTIAVLGCGIDVLYPKQHARLREAIEQNGAVVTAYPPGTPAYPANFPERNKIISGLSAGTVVIEAPAKSGALITARHAATQSRNLYALPGSIEEENSYGPNALIREGAMAVTCGRDIVEDYVESHLYDLNMTGLRKGELRSEFDVTALKKQGVFAVCAARGPDRSPKEVLASLQGKPVTAEKKEAPPRPKSSAHAEEDAPKETKEVPLSSLDDKERAIFEVLPTGAPFSLDSVVGHGFSAGDAMATLLSLELKGLVGTLPGGLYIRK